MQKVFLILGVCTLGIIVGVQMPKEQVVVSEVVLENVEALAGMEIIVPKICRLSGDVTCPDNGVKVRNVYEGYGWEPDEETH